VCVSPSSPKKMRWRADHKDNENGSGRLHPDKMGANAWSRPIASKNREGPDRTMASTCLRRTRRRQPRHNVVNRWASHEVPTLGFGCVVMGTSGAHKADAHGAALAGRTRSI